MPVKQASIELPKPAWNAGANWTVSCVITGHLVVALCRTAEFRSIDHALLMGEGREVIQRKHEEEADTTLLVAWVAASKPDAQRLGRIHWNGTWISVLPSIVNGIELWAQEWRDSLFLRYSIKPTDFPPNYESCGIAFYICHALDCKEGGLIMARNNKICDGVLDLAGKAFTPAHVRDEPKIFTGRAVQVGKAKGKAKGKGTEAPPPEERREKGGLLIWNL